MGPGAVPASSSSGRLAATLDEKFLSRRYFQSFAHAESSPGSSMLHVEGAPQYLWLASWATWLGPGTLSQGHEKQEVKTQSEVMPMGPIFSVVLIPDPYGSQNSMRECRGLPML